MSQAIPTSPAMWAASPLTDRHLDEWLRYAKPREEYLSLSRGDDRVATSGVPALVADRSDRDSVCKTS